MAAELAVGRPAGQGRAACSSWRLQDGSGSSLSTKKTALNAHPPAPKPTPAGIVKAVGKSLGKEPKVVLYSPEKVGTGKGGKAEGFPFR